MGGGGLVIWDNLTAVHAVLFVHEQRGVGVWVTCTSQGSTEAVKRPKIMFKMNVLMYEQAWGETKIGGLFHVFGDDYASKHFHSPLGSNTTALILTPELVENFQVFCVHF